MKTLLWVLLLVSLAHAEPARWTRVAHAVDVRILNNDFVVDQEWRVTGATVAQLLAGVPHLTLSGRHGVYGDRELLATDVPELAQNDGDGVSAWAHPVLVPRVLGARASTVPTATGFRASMSGGVLGCGQSEVTIEAFRGAVRIREHGTYSLARLRTGHRVADLPYRFGAATLGRAPLAAAHKAMGELHNRMFNAAEPLVNMVNDLALR